MHIYNLKASLSTIDMIPCNSNCLQFRSYLMRPPPNTKSCWFSDQLCNTEKTEECKFSSGSHNLINLPLILFESLLGLLFPSQSSQHQSSTDANKIDQDFVILLNNSGLIFHNLLPRLEFLKGRIMNYYWGLV